MKTWKSILLQKKEEIFIALLKLEEIRWKVHFVLIKLKAPANEVIDVFGGCLMLLKNLWRVIDAFEGWLMYLISDWCFWRAIDVFECWLMPLMDEWCHWRVTDALDEWLMPSMGDWCLWWGTNAFDGWPMIFGGDLCFDWWVDRDFWWVMGMFVTCWMGWLLSIMSHILVSAKKFSQIYCLNVHFYIQEHARVCTGINNLHTNVWKLIYFEGIFLSCRYHTSGFKLHLITFTCFTSDVIMKVQNSTLRV